MDYISYFIVIIFSYFLGSVPYGLVITKIFTKKDIRTIGSGNIGMTNVLRSGHKYLAIITLLLDFAKTILAILLAKHFFSHLNHIEYIAYLTSLLGHIFPIWLKFKGGKGVSSFFGGQLALNLPIGLTLMAIWIIFTKLSKISSIGGLSSVTAALIFQLFSWQTSNILFTFLIFILLFWTHRKNIFNIIHGKESKIVK